MTAKITVVGGAYGERCCYPNRIVRRGSGFRAACVLRGLETDVQLHSVIAPQQVDYFQQIAQRRGINLIGTEGTDDIWFRYRHPLAIPEIAPITPSAVSQKIVETNDALVFGMLEGRPQVKADRVVYDPQDGVRSKAYESNGSTANELVIVASLSEALIMSGQTTPEGAAEKLLDSPSCTVAIVKCGPQGALVATHSSQEWVGSFPSKGVWKIGSGDVFSAAYSFAWLAEGMSPLEAAWFASRMVSEYVETKRETLPQSVLKKVRADALSAINGRTSNSARKIPNAQIYLAGPFFTTNQQWWIDETREAFQNMGFKVFSPVHEIGIGGPDEVVEPDLKALEESALVFALLDGLDTGTIFELGYARAKNIPVICVFESLDERPLTMMLGSRCKIVKDFATAVYTACWELMGDV